MSTAIRPVCDLTGPTVNENGGLPAQAGPMGGVNASTQRMSGNYYELPASPPISSRIAESAWQQLTQPADLTRHRSAGSVRMSPRKDVLIAACEGAG